ncbi:hypothetical protein Pflav_016020 [Phytohabitans flavus]|uniref:Tyr recombinase domain-containing protein n=1 Tax=Phytohabitans flavus TaxID=1076124 RepID=A0A6F8XMY9_9ACTN|nr:hypothetical protein Pflav_016020 [Phytohabitans flavus]
MPVTKIFDIATTLPARGLEDCNGDGRGRPQGARRVGGAEWATLKELMARIGHSSTRAAVIYQHATRTVTGRSRQRWTP